MKNEIIDNEYYSSRKLIDMQILPWRSANTFNKMLQEEEWQKIFQPIIMKRQTKTFYKIKGKYINNYLKKIN